MRKQQVFFVQGNSVMTGVLLVLWSLWCGGSVAVVRADEVAGAEPTPGQAPAVTTTPIPAPTPAQAATPTITAPANQGLDQTPQAVEKADASISPAGSEGGRMLAQPGLTRNELRELVEVVSDRVSAELGYRVAGAKEAALVPKAPKGLDMLVTLSRVDGGGVRLLQLGSRSYVSQPGQFWLIGQTVRGDQVSENDEVAQVVQMVQAGVQSNQERAESIGPTDLKTARIELSYIEADRCLGVLKSLGIQTIEYKKTGEGVGRSSLIEPTGQVDTGNLPAVMLVPGPEGVGLVGGSEVVGGRNKNDVTGMMSVATDLPNMTSAAPMMHLLVFYHPYRPEQYAKVLDLIRRSIDRPAGQIVIEAMVLEISETGLKQLGVEWELETPFVNSSTLSGLDDVQLGRFPNFQGSPTLDVTVVDINNHWRAQIKALVTSRQAEILSRPSVLTLDNRQASIRVGEDIPIATSVTGTFGGDKISFNFKYIPVGILLNVRPRISADGEEVSMQIDAVVSAQVPGEDLVIVDNNGDELARAPRIASRRVQTQTRIANNTPFIIGGLVSKDSVELEEKVPFLGDLPLIGNLFKSTTTSRLKREVIIVITPYVLPHDRVVGRNMPEDKDTFDSFDNELFRDAYRIRAEDVFDLRFLFENLQVDKMLGLAGQVLRRRPDLADMYPFDRYAEDRIPGERILVYRQMYEVIKRRGIDDNANPSRMIFFKDDPKGPAGFSVEFLEEYLAERLGVDPSRYGKGENWLFEGLGDQAVAMVFTERVSGEGVDAPTQPVPEIKLVDCPDRDAWGAKLWEMNQPDQEGRRRFTVLLKDERDMRRLRRAIVVKSTVQLNATEHSLRLKNFTQGRLLLVPTIKDDQVFLIDEDVAQYFFYTEHYYPALQKELQRDMDALRVILHDPEYARFLDNSEDLDRPSPWKPTGR
jgi:type II secretory pathway component GspD/PulD (secretin)